MGGESAVNPMGMLIPYALIFAVFYFLVIKPQKDKQKQHEAMVGDLKKNDEVVTSGGIHGTVVNTKDATITVRVDDNVKIEIDRSAVLRVIKKT
ncbi:MAG: preprotein translocase subunit YajC [Candidatus Aceula meridiana]|nr:preprotein translocase subunit YajC [Candidatus Aceula meridiana]